MQLTLNDLSILEAFSKAGDRIGYYVQLAAFGDRYAELALSVVNNDTSAGASANIFLIQEARGDRLQISFENLANISIDLMQADFLARQDSVSQGDGGNIGVDIIRQYHNSVFNEHGLEADAWTPEFAMANLSTLEERQELWDELLTSTAVGSFLEILEASVPTDNPGASQYITSLIAAGAQAQFAESSDYGPFTLELGNQLGVLKGGNYLSNTLNDTEKADILIGFDGDDVLTASYGNDRVYGGQGNDVLVGGAGNDLLVSNAHDSRAFSGFYDDDDIVFAGTKVESADGQAGPSTDDRGNDIILTGQGDDVVYIGGGSDIVSLGDGNDEINVGANTAGVMQSIVWGGNGADKFVFETSAHILLLDVGNITDEMLLNLDAKALFQEYNGTSYNEYPYDFIILNPDSSDRFFLGGVEITSISLQETHRLDEYDWSPNYTTEDVADGINYVRYDATSVSKTKFSYTDKAFVVDGHENIQVSTITNERDQSGYRNEVEFSDGNNSIDIGGFTNGVGGIQIIGNGLMSQLTKESLTAPINVTSLDRTVIYDSYKEIYHIPKNYTITGDAVYSVEQFDYGGYLKSDFFDAGTRDTQDLNNFQLDLLNPTHPPVGTPDVDGVTTGSIDDEVLVGTTGNDIFRGNGGADFLYGDAGSDVYQFGWLDGRDTINDWSDFASTDVIKFDEGISADDIAIGRGQDDFWDMELSLFSGDAITVKGGFLETGSVIEQVVFADGVVWTRDMIRERYLDQASTDGGDVIEGFVEVADVIDGKAGNDLLRGYSGNDSLGGGTGNDEIFGDDGNDILIGGAGEDFLVGGAGADRFVFTSGSGEDWIDDFDVTSDKIDLRGFADIDSFSSLISNAREWVAGSTWLYANEEDFVRLEGVSITQLREENFLLS